MPTCWKCLAETTADHYNRVAENRFALHWEDWAGWKFSGKFLIAPGNAGRIVPRRLLGMLWEERRREQLKAACPISAQVVQLPARERFDGQA